MRELYKFFAGVTFWKYVVHLCFSMTSEVNMDLMG